MAKRRTAAERATKDSKDSKVSKDAKDSGDPKQPKRAGARPTTRPPEARTAWSENADAADSPVAARRRGAGIAPEASSTQVEFNARVARKAYDLFESRGREEGHDVEDWLEAERLVREEFVRQPGTGT